VPLLVGFAFGYRLHSQIIKKQIMYIFLSEYKEFTSPHQLLRKCVMLKNLGIYLHTREKIDIKDENQLYSDLQRYDINQLLFIGFTVKHATICTEHSCYCKDRKSQYDNLLEIFGDENTPPYEDIVAIKYRIKKVFMEGLQKFPRNIDLMIHFSLFFASQLRSIHMSYIIVSATNNIGKTFWDKFNIF